MKPFKAWSTGDKLTFLGLPIALVGTVAAVLSIPGMPRVIRLATDGSPSEAPSKKVKSTPENVDQPSSPSTTAPGASAEVAPPIPCVPPERIEKDLKKILSGAASGLGSFRGLKLVDGPVKPLYRFPPATSVWKSRISLTDASKCTIEDTYPYKEAYLLSCEFPQSWKRCSESLITAVEDALNTEEGWRKKATPMFAASPQEVFLNDQLGKITIAAFRKERGGEDLINVSFSPVLR